MKVTTLWVGTALALLVFAAESHAASRPATDSGDLAKSTDWIGVQSMADGAAMVVPGEATFRYTQDDAARTERNWYNAFGVRFDVRLEDDRPVRLEMLLRTAWDEKDRSGVTASTLIAGSGWHTVSLPWNSFDFREAYSGFLHDIKGLSIAARFEDGSRGHVVLRRAQLVRGDRVCLQAPVRGRSVEAGGTAQYEVQVGNPTNTLLGVTFAFDKSGYEAMTSSVEPASVQLTPGETRNVTLRVQVPQRIPPGGHETQVLRAIGNGVGSPADKLEFVTASQLPHPNILHTTAGWEEVRDKVRKYDWAKASQQDYVARADKWNVPMVHNANDPKRGDWLFATPEENNFMAAGIAYQLTQDAKHARKVQTFLMRLSDPANGFPVTRRACNQASVQEGHFFQHIAMAYDMTIPSGVYSDAQRRQIDRTLRLFVGDEDGSFGGQISNWNVSSQCGALYCALVLQDLAAANRLLYGPGALIDQLAQGTLDDGWWYEVSISYNTWVASEFSQIALAMRPWGLDLANTRFPGAYRPNQQRIPEKTEYGITDAEWGPIQHNWMGIKRMWDVLPRMVDYRSVMFGLNDSTERAVGGEAMELAYYLYRDPAYATVIRRAGGNRDLLYGVPELPANAPDLSALSTYADNAGVAVLRSRSAGKPDRERIQAVLRYGDHGWYHGHFDRTDLVHLSRYGRSFYNPEMVWYGYGSYLYKFYVQTSVNKNMVVVDQKQQEPAESQRLLFHAGDLMQVSAVQTTARWSNPPYGGIVDEKLSFAEKAFSEGRSIPMPAKAPPYMKIGSVTGYTELILQRRLMVVTDDYVVLADYLKAGQEHTFDALFQMKGFQGLEAPEKTLARHTGQWNPDPIGSAQFVTDCDWYQVSAPARGSYQFRWGEGADNSGTRTECNEPGTLNLDIHTLWPAKQEIMIGTVPETHGVERQVSYCVRGDGKTLAEGKSGMWILGEVNLDIPLQDLKTLELETRTSATKPATLFWAGLRVVTSDGKQIPLSELPLTFANTTQPTGKGQDFAGGPIKIAGIAYTQAVSAQPQNGKQPAVVKVDLSGINAVRFTGVLGGDYPLGDESQRRKTMAVRSIGKTARFLTVIEPFEQKRMVKSAVASGPDSIRIELVDGRVHEMTISSLDGDGSNIVTTLIESRGGTPLHTERTAP